MESSIAEKFQTMVKLGILNSRMKDFYDIWLLSRIFDFEGKILAEAINKTFANRNTPVIVNPAVFDPNFMEDADKQIQWSGFLEKAKRTDAPLSFKEVTGTVKAFIEPLATSLVENHAFRFRWIAPGPWRDAAN